MPIFKTGDGTEIYFKDWGKGRPIVFSHGWPLSSDAFEDQMFFLAGNGYRCIGHDLRGHGRSSQPWDGNDMDHYADDLAELVDHLDLKDAIHVGHSSTKRVAKAVLIGAVPPVMIKKPPIPAVRRSKSSIKFAPACSPTARNTGRTSPCHSTAITGRTRRSPKACASRSGCKAWPGCRPAIFCVKAFSETDLTEDLK